MDNNNKENVVNQDKDLENDIFKSEAGITEEDREELLQRIEGITSENRITLDDSNNSALKSARSGILFPIAINVLAIVVVAIVIVILGQTFQNDTNTIVRSAIEFSSLEGQLLRELQRESQGQLSAKDQEITSIENRIGDLELQLQDINSIRVEKLLQRENEYETQIQNELRAEQQRLEAQGISRAEINRLLQLKEEELRTYYTGLLNEYEAELLQEQEELQNNILTLRDEYNQEIQELRSERDSILEGIRAQEASLRSELESQTQVVQNTTSNAENSSEVLSNLEAARNEIAELAQQRERVDAAESQLTGLYEQIQTALDQSNFGRSLQLIQQTRRFLNDNSIVSLENFVERRGTNLFFLRTIEDYVNGLVQSEDSQNSITSQLEILNRIRTNDERARTAIANNNSPLSIYANTMTLLPQLQTASQALVSSAINQLELEQQDRQQEITTLLNIAEVAIANGEYGSAIDSLEDALLISQDFENLANRTTSNLIAIGYEITDGQIRGEDNIALFQRASIDPSETINFIQNQLDDISRFSESEFGQEIIELNDELLDLRTSLDESQSLTSNLQLELDRLQEVDQVLTTIQDKYNNYTVNVQEIRSTLEAEELGTNVQRLLEEFVGSPELDDVFPNLRTEIRSLYPPILEGGRVNGINEAKEIVIQLISEIVIDPNRIESYLENELEFAIEDNDTVREEFLRDVINASF